MGALTISALAAVPGTGSLARYEAMCRAIAECVAVDEAKDIRDKSLALEAYYRQARNHDAEREAANVRLRAERRVGELLKDLARADAPNPQGVGGRAGKVVTSDAGTQQSPYAETLERQGISRQAAHRFQALANVPHETFEAALAAPEKPSAAAVLKYADARRDCMAPTPKVSDRALGLWGAFRALEREGFLDLDYSAAQVVLGEMTDAMAADFPRLIPRIRDLLANLEPMNVDP